MAANKLSEVVYDFPYGETHTHTALAATDIPHLDDGKPGLYAWYVRVLPKEIAVDDLNFYGTFFGSKKYTVEMSAFLSEQYLGDLTLSPAFDAARSSNMALISTITTVFSPPIYVGIAKNIRKRLMSHLLNLKNTLNAPPPLPSPVLSAPSAGSSPSPSVDTDEESGYFGGRVAMLLRDHKMTDVRHLFVKVVFQAIDNVAERRAVEHYANRVFFPFCGRR